MSTTIIQIDKEHIEPIFADFGIGRRFKPSEYSSYGQAHVAIKTLMDTTGYSNLTQQEKEICGRWNLVTSQTELDLLFSTEEQLEIKEFQRQFIKSIVHSKPNTVALIPLLPQSIGYTRVGTFEIDEKINRILSVKLAAKINTGTYSAQLYDRTNHVQLLEKTGMSNTTYTTSQDLGNTTSMSSSSAMYEIHIKLDQASGEYCYESLTVTYI